MSCRCFRWWWYCSLYWTYYEVWHGRWLWHIRDTYNLTVTQPSLTVECVSGIHPMFHGFQSYPRRNIGTLDLLRPNPPMHPTSSSAVRLAVIYLQRLLLPICQSHTPQRHLHLHRQSHQLRARQQTRPPIAIHSNPLPGRSTIQIPTSFPIQEMFDRLESLAYQQSLQIHPTASNASSATFRPPNTAPVQRTFQLKRVPSARGELHLCQGGGRRKVKEPTCCLQETLHPWRGVMHVMSGGRLSWHWGKGLRSGPPAAQIDMLLDMLQTASAYKKNPAPAGWVCVKHLKRCKASIMVVWFLLPHHKATKAFSGRCENIENIYGVIHCMVFLLVGPPPLLCQRDLEDMS